MYTNCTTQQCRTHNIYNASQFIHVYPDIIRKRIKSVFYNCLVHDMDIKNSKAERQNEVNLLENELEE